MWPPPKIAARHSPPEPMRLPSTIRTWGSTPTERAAEYPCDRYLADADDVVFRAVDVAAPASVLFRWLCQLRVAPYSYDLIDNLGRRSPRTLTPGLDDLAVGQRVATIFRLVEFAPDEHLTIHHRGPIFGEVSCTYRVVPRDTDHSRLVVKLLVSYPKRSALVELLLHRTLPAGDLVMMRRQLLNLKRLAEATARADSADTSR
jgi:hypothetical protein